MLRRRDLFSVIGRLRNKRLVSPPFLAYVCPEPVLVKNIVVFQCRIGSNRRFSHPVLWRGNVRSMWTVEAAGNVERSGACLCTLEVSDCELHGRSVLVVRRRLVHTEASGGRRAVVPQRLVVAGLRRPGCFGQVAAGFVVLDPDVCLRAPWRLRAEPQQISCRFRRPAVRHVVIGRVVSVVQFASPKRKICNTHVRHET